MMGAENTIIYAIFKQVVKDLEEKVNIDFDNVEASIDQIIWSTEKEVEFTEEEKKQIKSNEDEEKRKTIIEKYIGIRFEDLANHGSNSKKYTPKNVIILTAIFNDYQEEVYLDLHWYDYLRPSMIRAKKLIKKAYAMHKQREMTELDKKLALIHSNRIDNILLGEKNEQKK